MILYLDTSAFVPLLVEEPTTAACRRLWNDADLVTTSRLTYVEATAALAQAARQGRVTDNELVDVRSELDEYWLEIDVIEIDDDLIRQAADAAVRHRLRDHNTVHCAAAESVADAELVAAAGDQQLLAAWSALGISVADTTVMPPDLEEAPPS